jgi:hypothetical protein
MNIPKGMSQDDNTCLLLKKTIYGLVQSAREFYNKLLSTLKYSLCSSPWDSPRTNLIRAYCQEGSMVR